ncbi:uncharacterized protein LOC107019499 [Solanum pennellii]|uniref:Uncharacterized protein LOC107019499 n=1 Tax=Solanum pennellii TaxID=28526 RepID=A0ABM1GSV3_SOLPN|nr:uncharacterized protein LOC107019499 [Solanum pennellii]
MPGYAKFMKDMIIKKRYVSFEDNDKLQHCSSIAIRSFVEKKQDHGAFTIPCTIGLLHFAKALCDLAANINLIPLTIYKKLGLGDAKPTTVRLITTDRIVKRLIGVLHDVLVKVESFIFLSDFVILDCEVDFESGEIQSVYAITFKSESASKVQFNEKLGIEALEVVIMNFESDFIEVYDELVAELDRCEYRSKLKKMELDMKIRETPPARPSMEEKPKLELKSLPHI